MRAIHAFGPKDVRLVEVPDPITGEGQVMVRVSASGICGSDKWLWRQPDPVDTIAGHEVAGEVVELGTGVTRLRVGDRVAINNVVGCGRCRACRAGDFVRCPEWTGAQDVNGGFGELVVSPERNCLRLHDSIDDVTGAQIFDNFGTPFSAIERSGITCGDDVLITGCGPIGLAAVMLAKLRGAYVIAVDPVPARRDFALSLGADVNLPASSDLPDRVRELTDGLGVRAVLECSGKSPIYPLAIDSLRIGGIFVSVGEGAEYPLQPSNTLIRRHLTLAGIWYSNMVQGIRLQEWILQKGFEPKALVSHTATLAEFPNLFRQVCEEPETVQKAIIVNGPIFKE